MRFQQLFSCLLVCLFWISHASALTLNIPLMAAPVSLDWNGLSTMIEAPIIMNLNEGLFGHDPETGKPIPHLAESLAKSPDLTEYTFKIRKNAKWSDGRAVLAGDFANAWLRLLSPQSGSIYIYYLFDILNAKEFNQKEISDPSQVGITVVDDQTLKVKLKRPHSDWERTTAFWPLFPIRKDQIEKFGSNWWRPGVLISSGPFVLESYEPGKSVVLKRNPHYPKVKSTVDTIDFKIGANQDEIIRKFKNGEFGLIWGMDQDLVQKGIPGSKPESLAILRGHLLAVNTAKFPMNNPEFRKGFLKAISTPDLIPANSGQLSPVETFIMPPLAGSEGKTKLDYSPVEAKNHIKKSGVLLGSKLKIRVLTNLSEPFYSIGKNLQAQIAKNLGIEIELAAHQSRDYTTYMNLGDYAATLITWTAKVLSPQDFLLPYSREAAYNRMNYSNPEFESRIFEGVRAKSSKEASKSFLDAQKLLAITDAVALPLFREKAHFLSQPSIKKIYFNHMGIPLLKQVTSK